MMTNEIPLGLGPSPRPEHIYISSDVPTGWYVLDRTTQEKRPIEHPALTGYIVKVEAIEREYQGRTNEKLQVHVSAGPRRYIIRTGIYTAFSRCLLAALAKLKVEHYAVPLSIEPQPSDKENKVVFANVYNAVNGGRVPYDYPQEDALVDRLFDHVRSIVAASRKENVPEPRGTREREPGEDDDIGDDEPPPVQQQRSTRRTQQRQPRQTVPPDDEEDDGFPF